MTDTADFRDWSAGKRLFRLRAAGVPLSERAVERLEDICQRHPDWKFDATERAEFSIWTGSFSGERGNPASLRGLAADKILLEARQKAQSDRFAYGGLWRNFTQENPALAFEALRARARAGDIQNDEWQQLFFKLREETSNRELDAQVLKFLDAQDLSELIETSEAIVSWLRDKRVSLESLPNGWARVLTLWDKVANSLIQSAKSPDAADEIDDIIMAVLNSTSGSLVELLVQRLVDLKPTKNVGLPEDIESRLSIAIGWPDADGLIAQCSLMQRLPWLEHIAPAWTWTNLIPLLQIDNSNWLQRWQARFYHTSIGSREMFARTKDAFLATFRLFDKTSRNDGQVLLLVRAAYTATRRHTKWPLTSAEARAAVAAGGSTLMSEIARILRHRGDEDSPETHWRKVVAPILDFLWPRDAKLQTKSTSRGLIRLMFDSRDAFPEAVSDFVHFIQPWDEDRPWEFDHMFDEEAVSLLVSHPDSAIRLLDAHVGQDAVPIPLNEILDRIELADKKVARRDDFSAMRGLARRSAA